MIVGPVVTPPSGSTTAVQIWNDGGLKILDLDGNLLQWTNGHLVAGGTAGPFTVITAIQVKNGLVTTLTGS